ncbi:class I SAM-dependent methyltransferase [Paenibacillus sp. NPDC057967]|uniref:class I SAM-dependent methyltransferase n=1 Tax=Paenibacillus sp. NPDC057967 TaxID=3346293 RepID=UPI0036DAE7BE
MPNHDEIYSREAERYDQLIASQPKLMEIVNEIRPLAGVDVLDMGAGTGRLTLALAPSVKSILATDASAAMLKLTGERLRASGMKHWGTAVADHRRLPLEDNCIDLVVSGWSICYLCATGVPEWRENLRLVMSEIERVLRPGGTAIIFETMGTGYETPQPPEFLLDYYRALEEECGFQHRWLRMDYQFESVEQAVELTSFFFGEELAERVRRECLTALPECAGVWWRQFP